jgi:hypothetical protein
VNSSPLRLHAETGKDWGLSVVGTRSELLSLARALERAALNTSEVPTSDFPTQILSPDVLSPYSDRQHFYLSFCVEGSRPSASVLTRTRSAPPIAILLGLSVLALVGVAAIVAWAWHAVP